MCLHGLSAGFAGRRSESHSRPRNFPLSVTSATFAPVQLQRAGKKKFIAHRQRYRSATRAYEHKMSAKSKVTTFQGPRNLRHRLVLATLAGKPIKIEKIRSDDLNPGLKDYEVSFLRLLEAVTNGSRIEISYTGTTVVYYPGIITGGAITHNCHTDKSIGYFMEPMLFLAPFSKKKFQIVFRGITGMKGDTSIEGLRWGILPLMEKFGVREAAIHTIKRGCPPIGQGEVHLVVDTLLTQTLTMHATEISKINAIRGVAFCARVSPSMVNRLIDSARDVLRPLGCEVNITADVWRGEASGKSPGFGLALVGETKKGWRYYSEEIGAAGEVPEDLGTKVALELLEQISHSGVVCKPQLALALTYMVIGKEDVGRLKITKEQIDEDLVWLLRDIKDVFGTEVYLKEDGDDFVATIKGVGFVNTSKKMA